MVLRRADPQLHIVDIHRAAPALVSHCVVLVCALSIQIKISESAGSSAGTLYSQHMAPTSV
jgi:hypothetical protein